LLRICKSPLRNLKNRGNQKHTYIGVLINAFPIKVAVNNFQNGTESCPHMMPARSNKGFGTCNLNIRNQAIGIFKRK